MFFRGGVLRFGKLTITDADMLALDADSTDPLDFYLDRYTEQLTAGYHRATGDLRLPVVLPDYADLGSAGGSGRVNEPRAAPLRTPASSAAGSAPRRRPRTPARGE